MGIKHSINNKKRWKSMTKEERSVKMSLLAQKKYKMMDIQERKKIGERLAIARKNNREFDLMP